ncbi:hypothetical protein ACF1AB_16695 [Streptomyces sp. NPDC014846]|uniref:hypothetical protein n=1 Tax=Streptomyces sp. NPDC014846 TaxID=3364922 RepID=UPI0036F74D60
MTGRKATHAPATLAGALPPANPTSLAALPPAVTDLLAAIVEALTVPLPSIDVADERAYHRLLEHRTTDVRVYVATMLDFADVDITVDAAEIRARTAVTPVTYAPYEKAEQDGGQ